MKTVRDLIPGVEEMLEWMLENPDAPAAYEVVLTFAPLFMDDEKAAMAAVVKAFGKGKKNYIADYITVKKQFGPHEYVRAEATCNRKTICERVVVGKKEVPEQIIKAHTEEIVEWKCGSILDGEGHKELSPVALPPSPALVSVVDEPF